MIRNYRGIEGWLCKEIQTQGMFQQCRRHLRYFRIVFNTGKLNIKEDKAHTKMRSFPLQDLQYVSMSELPLPNVLDIEPEETTFMSKSELQRSSMNPNEKWF